MAVFEFRGIQVATGKAVKGFRDADNAKALRGVLRKEGVLLTQATEESEKKAQDKRKLDLFAIFKRPTTSDVAIMTRQLATLVRAGVPLVESVAALTDQVEKQELVRVLTALRENLNEGTSFAKSLAQHPKIFPTLYVNMVAAGEASGTLEAVLESLGQELPWYTRLLIFVSETIAGFWWLMLLVAGVSFYFFRRWKRTPAGHLKFDTFMLRMPIFGRLNLLVAVARFSRTLATLLS